MYRFGCVTVLASSLRTKSRSRLCRCEPMLATALLALGVTKVARWGFKVSLDGDRGHPGRRKARTDW